MYSMTARGVEGNFRAVVTSCLKPIFRSGQDSVSLRHDSRDMALPYAMRGSVETARREVLGVELGDELLG